MCVCVWGGGDLDVFLYDQKKRPKYDTNVELRDVDLMNGRWIELAQDRGGIYRKLTVLKLQSAAS